MFLGRCSSAGYFENVLNWTGLCVEPNPEVFPRIASQAGRASGVQLAVSDTPGTLPFVAAYMRSSLNASAVDYAFLQSQGVVASSVEVRVTTPSLLLAGHRATRDVAVIDYVSVDVEQLELAILRAWPFDRYCVRLFNVENEPPDGAPSTLPQLKALLEPLGYEHVLRIGVDEVFRRTSPCAIAIDSPSGRHSGAMGGRGAPRATRKLRARGASRYRRKE
jgi:FkbM family methyltransferase